MRLRTYDAFVLYMMMQQRLITFSLKVIITFCRNFIFVIQIGI